MDHTDDNCLEDRSILSGCMHFSLVSINRFLDLDQLTWLAENFLSSWNVLWTNETDLTILHLLDVSMHKHPKKERDMKIYVIHENNEWVVPLRKAFEERDLPYEEWFLDQGHIDLSQAPPQGIFYNRMSASSHTRNHRYAPEYTSTVLAWLERHKRRVFNGSRALQLEVNKVAQYASLETFGVRVPHTLAAVGQKHLLEAAKTFEGRSFITKHNRAGKGLGVRLFHSHQAFAEYLTGPMFEDSVDGITLLQEYIEAPEPFITRVEFIGGKFVYAVRVDTSEGFELCPADACQIEDLACPVGEIATPKFQVIDGFTHENIERYASFLAANDIHVSGIEFIVDKEGVAYTYDVNTNTNYNPEAEAKAGVSGMGTLADCLGEALQKLKQ